MLKLERLVESGDELCNVASSAARVVFTFKNIRPFSFSIFFIKAA